MIAYINNTPHEILPGESILSFIRRNYGTKVVPTLCDSPNLEPFGSCRICVVDVALEQDGRTRAMAACHTPVTENMYLYPESENVQKLRKNIVELVLSDYPEDKRFVKSEIPTEFEYVVQSLGVDEVRYDSKGKNKVFESDTSHPYMRSDLNTCINCYRCVRACDEVQGEFVLNMMGRGFDSHIIKGMDVSFMESDCVSCGACSQTCPTDAISDIFQLNKQVPEKKTRTICTYCGVGCNLEISTVGEEITAIRSPYDAAANLGHTCLKGRYAFEFYNHPDRLRSPMIKRNGEFEEVSWDEAYDFIAESLQNIKTNHGPNAIAGISSARTPNEENYLMQKFMRAVIGTNNIDCCARVCHSPTALGMQRAFGTGAATNSIADLKYTDCIIVIGANPTDAHPVTGARIKQRMMKGVTGIVIDPRKIELARYAKYHLQLRPGTNVALLNMMLYYIISEGVEDKDFIANRTEGYEEFKKEILALNIDELESITGVKKELVRDAAIAYATANAAMEFHGLGVTEQKQGTFTVQLIADLAMITGNIGKKGAGVNPLRGQNNVQGAADMGCQPHQGAGYMNVHDPEINEKYKLFYGAEVPMDAGLKIPEMFEAAIDGKLKALWLIGEDVVQTDPNTLKVKHALQSLDLLIVQELFMTETARQATVLLPGASFLEKEGTFTNGERRVQKVQKVVPPLAGTKPDGQIIIDIMNRMGYEQPDYTAAGMLEEISQIVPFFAGIRWDELGENGKQWPVAKDGTDTQLLHEVEFKRGKGLFTFKEWEESNEILKHGKDFPYIITTNRELEHYNCGTMTRRTGNLEILKEDVLLINPDDAAREGIKEGDMVMVESPRGKVDIRAVISPDMLPGVLSSTFHFPEIMLNIITSDEHCSETMCPEYKVVSCRIRKSKGKFKNPLKRNQLTDANL
ncbi:MAG: formate dehydrogenase subunit alpha [Weeksellaceae bacterium]|nr:formate dehydrogenase subunit alpha [Weeksellaceae bacterium]